MRSGVKNFFSFTKKELNGLVILCIILGMIALAPFLSSLFDAPEVHNFNDFEKEIAAFRASAKSEHKRYDSRSKVKFNEKKLKPQYFAFDPNNLSEAAWKKLGLSERQIKVIKNFEAKGGRFYKKEDLKKIYSISPEEYAGLEPFISIPPAGKTFARIDYPAEKNEVASVDINSADSTLLETLKGIGPAFASRIIKYRNRLGGFHKKEQLLEIYGIDSVKYQQFQASVEINPAVVRRININTITFEELRQFPYLSYKQMNAIIQYRKQHGPYKSINDLRKIAILNEAVLDKMSFYLIF